MLGLHRDPCGESHAAGENWSHILRCDRAIGDSIGSSDQDSSETIGATATESMKHAVVSIYPTAAGYVSNRKQVIEALSSRQCYGSHKDALEQLLSSWFVKLGNAVYGQEEFTRCCCWMLIWSKNRIALGLPNSLKTIQNTNSAQGFLKLDETYKHLYDTTDAIPRDRIVDIIVNRPFDDFFNSGRPSAGDACQISRLVRRMYPTAHEYVSDNKFLIAELSQDNGLAKRRFESLGSNAYGRKEIDECYSAMYSKKLRTAASSNNSVPSTTMRTKSLAKGVIGREVIVLSDQCRLSEGATRSSGHSYSSSVDACTPQQSVLGSPACIPLDTHILASSHASQECSSSESNRVENISKFAIKQYFSSRFQPESLVNNVRAAILQVYPTADDYFQNKEDILQMLGTDSSQSMYRFRKLGVCVYGQCDFFNKLIQLRLMTSYLPGNLPFGANVNEKNEAKMLGNRNYLRHILFDYSGLNVDAAKATRSKKRALQELDAIFSGATTFVSVPDNVDVAPFCALGTNAHVVNEMSWRSTLDNNAVTSEDVSQAFAVGRDIICLFASPGNTRSYVPTLVTEGTVLGAGSSCPRNADSVDDNDSATCRRPEECTHAAVAAETAQPKAGNRARILDDSDSLSMEISQVSNASDKSGTDPTAGYVSSAVEMGDATRAVLRSPDVDSTKLPGIVDTTEDASQCITDTLQPSSVHTTEAVQLQNGVSCGSPSNSNSLQAGDSIGDSERGPTARFSNLVAVNALIEEPMIVPTIKFDKSANGKGHRRDVLATSERIGILLKSDNNSVNTHVTDDVRDMLQTLYPTAVDYLDEKDLIIEALSMRMTASEQEQLEIWDRSSPSSRTTIPTALLKLYGWFESLGRVGFGTDASSCQMTADSEYIVTNKTPEHYQAVNELQKMVTLVQAAGVGVVSKCIIDCSHANRKKPSDVMIDLILSCSKRRSNFQVAVTHSKANNEDDIHRAEQFE
jgi:hypothetical protein